MQMEVTRSLPVPLTDAEVADRVREAKGRTDDIAKAHDTLADLSTKTKATKEDIEFHQREVKRLVKIADAREEDRSVPCRWTYDLAANTATLYRTDSGELVESRAMTSEERREIEQKPLFTAQDALQEAAERFSGEFPDATVTLTKGNGRTQ